jgi:protein gp37
MGGVTAISWADHTFNAWIGCTKVSPACDGCYAEALMDKRYGRVEWGAPGKGNGTRVRTSAGNWHQPIRWNKKAAAEGTRPFVFCSSLADVFDNQIPVEWRRDLFDLIIKTPDLVWLLLTKRPQNIVDQFRAISHTLDEWPRNAAIGTTVEDQKRFDLNVPALRKAKRLVMPAFAFLSCEPLLGPLNGSLHDIDWVITGGETDQGGHKARPTHPDWYRGLRDQCARAGIAYHHKQNGEFSDFDHIGMAWNDLPPKIQEQQKFIDGKAMIKVGKHRSGRLLDGVEHDARPEVR